MTRFNKWQVLFLPFVVMLFLANASLPDKLTPEQKNLQADLEGSLIAPCCWTQTVDKHDSQAAEDVREQITELILQGKNKQEILDYFVAQPQYGERILATPSQKTLLGKLAYWLIPVSIVFGLAIVVVSLKHLAGGKRALPEQKAEKPVEAAKETPVSDLDDLVERELKELD